MANIAKGDLGVKSPLQKKKKISPLESFKLLNNLMHFNTSAPQKKKLTNLVAILIPFSIWSGYDGPAMTCTFR